MFARFVGLLFILYGLLLTINGVVEALQGAGGSPWWALPWLLLTGLGSTAAGTIFVLSIDGPPRFATKRWRGAAVALMALASLLPATLAPVLAVLSILMIPSIWIGLPEQETVPAKGG